MSTIIDGTTGITTDGLIITGSNVQLIKLETAKVSTSGTSIDFTSIPSWAEKITVMFNGVSTNGTSNFLLQLGSGSVETTGYLGSVIDVQTANLGSGGLASTSGLPLTVVILAAELYNGHMLLTNISSNIWISSHNLGNTTASKQNIGSGSKTISGTLDRVRITTVNGTDTFDAGSINILIEGSL
jgi:hypothetical protein